jgi:hypothetical protein
VGVITQRVVLFWNRRFAVGVRRTTAELFDVNDDGMKRVMSQRGDGYGTDGSTASSHCFYGHKNKKMTDACNTNIRAT